MRDGDGAMAAENGHCDVCGEALAEERRLMPTVGGAWAVVTVQRRCVNPRCRRSVAGSVAAAKHGPLVA